MGNVVRHTSPLAGGIISGLSFQRMGNGTFVAQKAGPHWFIVTGSGGTGAAQSQGAVYQGFAGASVCGMLLLEIGDTVTCSVGASATRSSGIAMKPGAQSSVTFNDSSLIAGGAILTAGSDGTLAPEVTVIGSLFQDVQIDTYANRAAISAIAGPGSIPGRFLPFCGGIGGTATNQSGYSVNAQSYAGGITVISLK